MNVFVNMFSTMQPVLDILNHISSGSILILWSYNLINPTYLILFNWTITVILITSSQNYDKLNLLFVLSQNLNDKG